jgi:hypothetical protein
VEGFEGSKHFFLEGVVVTEEESEVLAPAHARALGAEHEASVLDDVAPDLALPGGPVPCPVGGDEDGQSTAGTGRHGDDGISVSGHG